MGKRTTAWELWALAILGIWLKFFRGKTAPASTQKTPTPGAVPASHWLGTLGGGMLAVVHLLGMLMAFGALAGLVALGLRLFMRRRRLEAMVAEEIILGPDDVTKPEEVVAALDSIHNALLTRYGGGAMGQVSWTFEVIRDQDGQIHFVMAAPHRWLQVVEDNWRNVYTNLRFQPWGDVHRPWAVKQHLVLERPWRHPTRIDTTFQSSVVELMVQAMDRAPGEVRLQWLLTPLPVGPLTAQLRGSLQQMEYQARQSQQVDPAHPGLGVIERQDVSQASVLLGRSAFRAEVRLAADDWDSMQRVYGALAASNAENQWKAQTVWAFGGLWTRWLERRVPSMAFFGHTILFSKPLATLIHVPSARLRVQSLQRKLVRRGPAPPAIPRDPALAVVRDEQGPVGIPEGDRKFNTLFIGSQGGGKSTAMLQQIRVDAHWKDRQGRGKAMVLVDIGKDTGHRALGIVPKDREVIWFDPADPNCPWTLNPLQAGVHASALANDVLEGLTQVFGDDAIRARSREFLGNAILGVKDVHGDASDFTMVYKMLTDTGFRQNVIDHVQDPHQRDYWQVTFTHTVANNPRFVEEGLAAPRNKLDEVLRSELVRAALTTTPGRQQLDLIDVVQGRKILIANLDKVRLGKSGARLLGVFLITMLWHAMENQNDLPEAERVPTALVIDEAQNFISEGFLDILAEGRAYGAQTSLAVRFLGEITSERAILGIRTLVQNLIIFQFELRDEAEDFMKRFMRTYSNMISPSDEAQDNINFGADDFMRLPKHHVVCRWMVDGSPQQAFLAETIPWEPIYHESVKQWHLDHQPRLTAVEASDSVRSAGTDLRIAALSHATAGPGPEDLAGAAFDAGLDFDETPVASIPTASLERAEPDAPSDSLPPRWLTYLMDDTDPGVWWDRASGAGLAPVWDRMQDKRGQGVLWHIPSLEGVAPDWAAAIRSRAVQVARALTDADTVIAWASPTHLGVWLPKNAVCDEGAWQQAGAARNIQWTRVDVLSKEHPADDTPAVSDLVPETPPEAPQAIPPEPKAPVEPVVLTITPDLIDRFCKQTRIPYETIKQWQKQFGATDSEVAETMQWAVARRVAAKNAEQTVSRHLKDLANDRYLQPLCTQLHTDKKNLHDVLVSDADIKRWRSWILAHPTVDSLEKLQQAVDQARQRQREVAHRA